MSGTYKSIIQLKKERQRLLKLYETSGSSLSDQGSNLMNRIRSIEELVQGKEQERAKRPTILGKMYPPRNYETPRKRNSGAKGSPQWRSMDGDKSQEEEEGLFFSAIIREGIVEKRRLQISQEDSQTQGKAPTRESERLRNKQPKTEVVDLSCENEGAISSSCVMQDIKPKHPKSHCSLESLLSDNHVLYPASGGKGCVQITGSDLTRLQPDEYLNDVCVDFYLKYIEEKCPFKKRCYMFRSYFYTKLTENPSHTGENCRKWTKEVDIFNYDFIFVPICEACHWSLAIICFVSLVGQSTSTNRSQCTPCILHFDSLQAHSGHDTGDTTDVLRHYLEAEWERKHPELTPKVFTWKSLPARRLDGIPTQENSADCGLFLLVFLENFYYQLPTRLNHEKLEELSNEERPFFLTSKWLDVKNVGFLRQEIMHLMYEVFLEQIPTNHPAYEQLSKKLQQYSSTSESKYKSAEAVLEQNLEKWRNSTYNNS